MSGQETKSLMIAYLGPEGTFSEEAAKKYFSKGSLIPCPAIADVFTAVERKTANYGVVPAENSIEGSVRMTLDQMLDSELMICGEVDLNVVHNLISRSGTELEKIKIIMSHPQAIAQCWHFLNRTFPDVELRETSSTAKAVELLRGIDNAAAIGPEAAAERNAMVVMKRHIEDEPNNVTRFLILGRTDAKPTGRDKTSIVFSTKNVPGSLYKALAIFAARNINLTKIESRPEKRRPWNYIFYLDFEGHRTDAKSSEALEALREHCIYIKILGSYPKAS